MSRAGVLRAGRREAERGMVDTCLITRVTGSTTNRTTGVRTETTTDVYEGPCRVQEVWGFSRDTAPTPDQPQMARYRVLQLPVEDSEGIRVADIVEITACVHDPDLVGVRMVVRDQSAKSEATARRIGVEEITG
jgi:hypothetical protein